MLECWKGNREERLVLVSKSEQMYKVFPGSQSTLLADVFLELKNLISGHYFFFQYTN